MDTLVNAILEREGHYSMALDRVRGTFDEAPEDVWRALESMREAVELVRCLRRLVASQSVEAVSKAFGAPGAFGYENPIGRALAIVYGVRL